MACAGKLRPRNQWDTNCSQFQRQAGNTLVPQSALKFIAKPKGVLLDEDPAAVWRPDEESNDKTEFKEASWSKLISYSLILWVNPLNQVGIEQLEKLLSCAENGER